MFKRKVIVVLAACAALVLSSCKTEAPKSMATAVPTPITAVAVPARAGAVDGKTENSDAFMWELFAQITAPISTQSGSSVEFERWASDADTFTSSPHWPSGPEPLKFHASVLALAKSGALAQTESGNLAPAGIGGKPDLSQC